MFEISQLKEKKLTELQEIAKELKVPRATSLKKLDLIYQILDLQAARPTEMKNNQNQKKQHSMGVEEANTAKENKNEKLKSKGPSSQTEIKADNSNKERNANWDPKRQKHQKKHYL